MKKNVRRCIENFEIAGLARVRVSEYAQATDWRPLDWCNL
jgi:hypothetical protein